MKIKTGIIIGSILNITTTMIIIFVGLYTLYKTSESSEKILKDNYLSVNTVNELLHNINKIDNLAIAYLYKSELSNNKREILYLRINNLIKESDKKINIQENNITEIGERDLTLKAKNDYLTLMKYLKMIYDDDYKFNEYVSVLQPQFEELYNTLSEILRINDQALIKKNNDSISTFSIAKLYIIGIGVILLLLSVISTIVVPSIILKPINGLIKKISLVSQGDYSQPLVFKHSGELELLANTFNEMLKKLDEYKRSTIGELMSQKNRFETIIKSISDGVILIDENKKIIWINSLAAFLLGVSEKDILDKDAYSFSVTNDLFRELFKKVEMVVDKNNVNEADKIIKISIQNAEEYFIQEVINIFSDTQQEKRFLGNIIFIKNITEYKKLDEAKTNYILTVAHELTTPLSAIGLGLSLLQDDRMGSLNEEQTHIISSVKDELQRFSSIISRLIEINKVESSHFVLDFENAEPQVIVDYAISSIKIPAKEKDISIKTQIDSKLPIIKIDPEKIVWVLTNLIGNAVRYTPNNGTIKISATYDKSVITFCVEDYGKGIEEKYLQNIFEKFVQIKQGGSIKKGFGLGLAISKEIILAHNGNIWAESKLGEGSKFYFTIPVNIDTNK